MRQIMENGTIFSLSDAEQAFIESKTNSLAIYQVRNGPHYRDYRFEPHDYLRKQGLGIHRRNYEHVYTQPITKEVKNVLAFLEHIFQKYNIDRPTDFEGRDLCISDVVALKLNGVITTHFVDRFGYESIENFLPTKNVPNRSTTIPVTEKPVIATIDFYAPNGTISDTISYKNEKIFMEAVKTLANSGVPYGLKIYQDEHGQHLAKDWIHNLTSPPKMLKMMTTPHHAVTSTPKQIVPETKMCRFIDPNYKDLFQIPDGGKVEITYCTGQKTQRTCKYLDEYHTSIDGMCFHIREFSERMAGIGATYRPAPAVKERER